MSIRCSSTNYHKVSNACFFFKSIIVISFALFLDKDFSINLHSVKSLFHINLHFFIIDEAL